MRNHRVVLVALVALLAGLIVGFLQGGQLATASQHLPTSALPIQSVDSASTLSPLRAFQAGPSQPLPNAASGARQVYTISDASGAVCDVQPDPP